MVDRTQAAGPSRGIACHWHGGRCSDTRQSHRGLYAAASARGTLAAAYDVARPVPCITGLPPCGNPNPSPSPSSTVYYHYTDDAGVAGITLSGLILPSKSDGRVYVSPTRYTKTLQAQQELALPTPRRWRLAIPSNRLPGVTPPSIVKPDNSQPGGGLEAWVTYPVVASGLTFQELSL